MVIRALRRPNIWRTTVIGCEAKYELTKSAFGQETGSTVILFEISDRRDRQNTDG